MDTCKFKIFIATIMIFNLSYAFQTSDHIVAGAKTFLVEEIQKQHQTVDPSTIEIKILNPQTISDKFCNNKVNYYFPIYSNINKKTTIIAECKAQNSWKIYVPVNIKFFANVLSVKKSLPKLHIINKEDLIQKKINVIALKNPYFANLNEVVGLVLKNSVKQDTVLTSNLLEKVEHGA